jgi:Na+/proline symporter
MLVGYVIVGGMMASIIVEWFQSLLQSLVMLFTALIAMYMVSGGQIFNAFGIAKATMSGKAGFTFNPFAPAGRIPHRSAGSHRIAGVAHRL